MAKARRTTHRSSKGKKLYAVRDRGGKLKDIQTCERAHSADIKRRSAAEEKASAARSARAKKKQAVLAAHDGRGPPGAPPSAGRVTGLGRGIRPSPFKSSTGAGR